MEDKEAVIDWKMYGLRIRRLSDGALVTEDEITDGGEGFEIETFEVYIN